MQKQQPINDFQKLNHDQNQMRKKQLVGGFNPS